MVKNVRWNYANGKVAGKTKKIRKNGEIDFTRLQFSVSAMILALLFICNNSNIVKVHYLLFFAINSLK